MFQKKLVEKIKTHIFRSITFFFFENHTFYELIWQNIVKPGRQPMTIRHIRSSVLHYNTLSALFHLSTYSYLHKNKENSVGGVCSTHGGNECKVLVGKPERKTKFYVGVH